MNSRNRMQKKKGLPHLQKTIENKFTNYENHNKVKDHCHYTGKGRDSSYGICNLVYPKKLLCLSPMDETIILILS